MRRLTMLLVSTAMALLATPGALVPGSATAAGPGRATSPSVRVESVRVVARGAAAEVNYRVTCPKADYLSVLYAKLTQYTSRGPVVRGGDTLELVCSGRPQRLTNLVPAAPGGDPFVPGRTQVRSELENCAEELPECYDVRRTDTLRAKRGGYRPETTKDVDARLRMLSATVSADRASVDVRYALTCVSGLTGYLSANVTQVSRRTGVVANAHGLEEIACTGDREVHTVHVQYPDDQRFHGSVAVVEGDVSDCNEPIGCFQGLRTSKVRLRLASR